jgi:hypothetical protein
VTPGEQIGTDATTGDRGNPLRVKRREIFNNDSSGGCWRVVPVVHKGDPRATRSALAVALGIEAVKAGQRLLHNPRTLYEALYIGGGGCPYTTAEFSWRVDPRYPLRGRSVAVLSINHCLDFFFAFLDKSLSLVLF